MSAALFTTRLYWDGRQGIAKLHGQQVVLHQAPAVPGLPDRAQLDYAPETATRMVRGPHDHWRDMTPEEVRCCDAYLYSTCGPAVAAVNARLAGADGAVASSAAGPPAVGAAGVAASEPNQ